jgi:hypothetical protein
MNAISSVSGTAHAAIVIPIRITVSCASCTICGHTLYSALNNISGTGFSHAGITFAFSALPLRKGV